MIERLPDHLSAHRRQVVLHSAGGVDRSIVSLEISVTGVHFRSLLLHDLHKPVQQCPDECSIDNSPLGDMVGEDFTLQLKKTMGIVFFLIGMEQDLALLSSPIVLTADCSQA
jgi:hypothetical protein